MTALASAAASCRTALPIFHAAIPGMRAVVPRAKYSIVDEVIAAAEGVARGEPFRPIDRDIVSAIPVCAARANEEGARQIALAALNLYDAAKYCATKPEHLAAWCAKVEEHANQALMSSRPV